VFVAEGANAVWVRKRAATIVWAFASIVPFISGVGWPAAEGPQEASNIPMKSNVSNERRVMIHLIYVFASSKIPEFT
jgi:hypothetical protein